MYRYRSLEQSIKYVNDVVEDVDDIPCPFSIYILMRICISLLTIAHDYFELKGL